MDHYLEKDIEVLLK